MFSSLLVFFSFQLAWTVSDPLLDPWVLSAHGSTRFSYKGSTTPWTSVIDTNFPDVRQFPIYMAVIGLTPNGVGGMIQRASDGHLHIQVVGGNYSEPSNTPYGPQCTNSPPFVYELDGDTGKIIRIYNLAKHGKFFTQPLRYTPDGHVIATLFNQYQDYFVSYRHTIVILDKESTNVIWKYLAPEPPHLLAVANSKPPTLVFSSAAAVASLTFTTSMSHPDETTFVRTVRDSTIIFGTDGKTLYNDVLGEPNEPVGIWKMTPQLPLLNTSTAVLFIPDCYTYPWLMAFDTNENTFAVCYFGWKLPIDPYDQHPHYVTKFDRNGKEVWRKYQLTARFLTLTDDENILFVGNENEVMGYEVDEGEPRWKVTPLSFVAGRNVKSLECFYGANPWSPRHPIPLASGRIAFLCATSGSYEINVIDSSTGAVIRTGIKTIFPYRLAVTADGNDNIYVFGVANVSDPHATVQRVHV